MRKILILLFVLLLVSCNENNIETEKLYIYEIHTISGIQDTVRLKTKPTIKNIKSTIYIHQSDFGYFYVDKIKYLGSEEAIE